MAKVWRALTGPIGVLSLFATLFPTLWGTALSAVILTLASVWTFGLNFFERAEARTVGKLFLVCFWTVLGLNILAIIRRPLKTIPSKDFRYGLTYCGLFANLDTSNDDCLQFTVQLQNFSPSAIRYEFESFSVRIGSRSLPDLEDGKLKCFMPRGSTRASSHNAFRKNDLKEFFGQRVDGTAAFAIVYGDADGPFCRRLRMNFNLYMIFPIEMDTGSQYQWSMGVYPPLFFRFTAAISKESDEEIKL